MLRWLKIHKTKPAYTLDASRLIHSLIGLDVPPDSSFPDDEDIALYTTLHQAIVLKNTTQPMETIKIEKRKSA